MKKFLFWLILSNLSFFAQSAEILESYELNKSTHVYGPTSGQFTKNNETKEALLNNQQIIGLSGAVNTLSESKKIFITDNGFGSKNNSADFIPRIYEIGFNDYKAHFTGRYLQFNDKNRKLNFSIQADYLNYYNKPENPIVDFQIRADRVLTGADIDPEAVVVDKHGHIWISEEFGPFLIETDSKGTVLHAPYGLADIISPDQPGEVPREATTKKSGGFEAMAFTPDEKYLILMLEQSVLVDKEGDIRLYQFDLSNKKFLEQYSIYHLDTGNMSISDMVAINNHQFLVLEDNAKMPKIEIPNTNKKIYLIDLNLKSDDGSLVKELICDVQSLFYKEINNQEHKPRVRTSFLKSSEEIISIIDKNTLLIANDNNARSHTHFIKIRIDKSVNLIASKDYSGKLKFEFDKEYTSNSSIFHDNTLIGWFITLLYFILSARLIFVTIAAKKYASDYTFWLLITLAVIFLSINKQLDIQTYITDYLRHLFRENGWYESRRQWQKLFVAITLLATFITTISVFYFYKHIWIKYKTVLIGFLIIITYILIRLISFHHIDQYLKKVIFMFKYHQVFELTGILVMMMGVYKKSLMYQFANFSRRFNIKTAILKIDFDGQEINCPKCASKMVKPAEDHKVFKCRKCRQVFTTVVERFK